MKILVMDETAKVFSLECESSDTIAHLKAKWKTITTILKFDGKELGDNLSDNMTLADVGIQDGSLILEADSIDYFSCKEDLKIGRPQRPEKDYLYYADAFKSGWREEHAKLLLHLLLELCQDGTISEGNVTDEAWLKIQNSLKSSMKCSFEIDFLKERLRDYHNLYTVLAIENSSLFEWDDESKTITMDDSYEWKQEYPELLLLCGPHMPYFGTLEKVCKLVDTTRSTVQRVSETSTNNNNAREASSSRGEICILLPSDSNFGLMVCSTLIVKENGYLSSTMKILVVDTTAKFFSLECEFTDTIAHVKAKLKKIKRVTFVYQRLMIDGKELGDEFSENMMLADVGVQDGSLVLIRYLIMAIPLSGIIERPRQRPEKDYLYYADAFKSGWREEHAKALLHLLLELCQDGTISEGKVTDEGWLRVQNNLNNSMKCSFRIDFLKERLCDYKELYSVLTETSSRIFEWNRERKSITLKFHMRPYDDWRLQYPVLLLLCGPHIPYFDTLEEVCLFLNTGQSSEQRISESSTNISTMHVNQVRPDIPQQSMLRRLFNRFQRS